MEPLLFLLLVVCMVVAVPRLEYYRGRPGDDASDKSTAQTSARDRYRWFI